jgi:hypothetical protein
VVNKVIGRVLSSLTEKIDDLVAAVKAVEAAVESLPHD